MSLNQVAAEIDVPLLDGDTQRSPRAGMYDTISYILLFCGCCCRFEMILMIHGCDCLRQFGKVCLQFDVVDCILALMLYLFSWVFTGTDKVEATVSAFIRSHLPEAVLVENLSSELIYQLPDDTASVGKFEQLFVDLDRNLTGLGISGYGISNTSLEEVRVQ